MRNNKKYLAALMAATMVLGSSATVFASGTTVTPSYVSSSNTTITDSNSATGTIGGTGGMEGTASTDVFCVEVPAVMTGEETFDGFDFVLDPQGLITATQASKYGVSGSNVADDFEEGKTLYFTNKTDRKLSDTSDLIKVTNKSSMPVNITLDAALTGLSDIEMTDDKTFADDDSTSLYLALKDTEETPIVSDGAVTPSNVASVSRKIDKAPDGAYEITENGGNYEYTLVDDAADFKTYEFALTGACNAKGDWSAVGDSLSVQITWTIEAYEESAPSIAVKEANKPASGDVTFAVDLGAGEKKATGITSISFINPPTNKAKDMATDNYSLAADGTLTIKAAAISALDADRTYTITFNDTAKTKIEVTVKVTN